MLALTIIVLVSAISSDGLSVRPLNSVSNGVQSGVDECPLGTQWSSSDNQCLDIDECALGIDNCDHQCQNHYGSYVCKCITGYYLDPDQRTCAPKYDGQCPEGFEYDSTTQKCRDIDECSRGTSGCQQQCSNHEGGYTCSCDSSHILTADQHSCQRRARTVKTDKTSGLDKFEIDDDGKLHCIPGTKYDEKTQTCLDIDECASNSHGCEQRCHNIEGSYRCSCRPGFLLKGDHRHCISVEKVAELGIPNVQKGPCAKGFKLSEDSQECVDIDECASSTHDCDHQCDNVPGGFVCSCEPPFVLSRRDYKSCIMPTAKANSGQVKEQQVGERSSRRQRRSVHVDSAACKPGLTLSADGKCIDINECLINNGNCEHLCHNLLGSYICSCPDHYDLASDGRGCVPWKADMIMGSPGITDSACFHGFILNPVNNDCIDINECYEGTAGCDQICHNHEGGYTCSCDKGYILLGDNRSCRPTSSKSTIITTKQHHPTIKQTTQHGTSATSITRTIERSHVKPITTIVQNAVKNVPIPHLHTGSSSSSAAVKITRPGRVETTLVQRKVSQPVTITSTVQEEYPSTHRPSATDTTFTVTCRHGLQLAADGLSCQDVDECSLGLHNCEQVCQNLIGGYVCSCHAGLTLAADQSSCITEQLSVVSTGPPVIVYGPDVDTEGHCSTGYSLDLDANQCIDIDECASINVAGCDQICRNWPGSYTCACEPGFYLHSDQHTCVKIDTVPVRKIVPVTVDPIHPNEVFCGQGYIVSKDNTCQDIDECQLRTSGCSQVCINRPGHFTCSCVEGYYLADDQTSCIKLHIDTEPRCQHGFGAVSLACADINECALGIHKCDGICNNWPGGYTCACETGFYLAEDQHQCIPVDAQHVGEEIVTVTTFPGLPRVGSEYTNVVVKPRDRVVGRVIVPADGTKFESQHKVVKSNTELVKSHISGAKITRTTSTHGTHGDALVVTNIQQSVGGRVPHPQNVIIEEVGYRIDVTKDSKCTFGFQLTGSHECADIDECQSGLDNCQQICRNWPGHFTCACEEGFYLDTDQSTCVPFATTVVHGEPPTISKILTTVTKDHICSNGFELTVSGLSCVDIDECSLNIHGCAQLCENTAGGYKCLCRGGFILSSDEKSCIDQSIDQSISTVQKTTRILDTSHSFTLRDYSDCVDGYYLTDNVDTLCADIDECQSGLDKCQQICNNWPGHYTCACEEGYYLDTDQISCIPRSDAQIIKFIKTVETGGINELITTANVQGRCQAGYALSPAGMCVDIDECFEGLAACDGECSNWPGGYTCHCVEGYYLNEDQHSCAPVQPTSPPGEGCLCSAESSDYELADAERQAHIIISEAQRQAHQIMITAQRQCVVNI